MGNPSATVRLCAPECAVYEGTWDVVRKLVRQEGPLALWRGTSAALLMAVPMVGIYLPCYDLLLHNLRSSVPAEYVSYTPLAAGATSRTLAVLCVAPLELVRTRMQARPANGASRDSARAGGGVMGSIASSLRTHAGAGAQPGQRGGRLDLRRLWTGVGPTLARDVPYSAVRRCRLNTSG